MAARLLQTRLFHHLSRKISHNSPFQESSYRFLPLIFERYSNPRRGVHTSSEPTIEEEVQVSVPSQTADPQLKVTHTSTSELKVSSRHDLALVYTCKVCETRSMKTCCRESYEKGVVVVRCGGCNNLHLIADRLGWFGEPGSIEDLLASRGEDVKRGSVDSLNFTLEDLAGKKL